MIKINQDSKAENVEIYDDKLILKIEKPPYKPLNVFRVFLKIALSMVDENQIAAIINYERSSWGNTAKKVSPEEIKKIMDFVKIKAASK